MKKFFMLVVAAVALFAVASCSMLDDSVESLEFAELPAAVVVNTQENSLTAKVSVFGGAAQGTYELTVNASGVAATKKGDAVVENSFAVAGYDGLAKDAEVGNYVLSISMEGLTLLHNYRVVAKQSDALFARGEGTEANPFEIETAQQLFNMRYAAKNSSFKIVNDINLTNFKWIAVGSVSDPFSGTLDGNNHKIIGLSNALTDVYTQSTTTSSGIIGDNFGLFGAAAGMTTVKNLTFEDVNINGSNLKAAAAVIGLWTPRANGDTVRLENIVVSGSISGKDKIAGLIGSGDNADNSQVESKEYFINCTNNANISASISTADSNRAAGFIAQIRDNKKGTHVEAHFENCVNNGNISCSSAKKAEAAGLVASLNLSNMTTLEHTTVINCVNNGTLVAHGATDAQSLTYNLYSGYAA